VCEAVCCSMLQQCVAVCCSVLRCVAVETVLNSDWMDGHHSSIEINSICKHTISFNSSHPLLRLEIHICLYMYIYIYTYIYIYIYICVFVYKTYICIYIYVCVCIYIHIHIYTTLFCILGCRSRIFGLLHPEFAQLECSGCGKKKSLVKHKVFKEKLPAAVEGPTSLRAALVTFAHRRGSGDALFFKIRKRTVS